MITNYFRGQTTPEIPLFKIELYKLGGKILAKKPYFFEVMVILPR